MFVVRRSFRGPRGPISAGSIIEPADIRNFRYRLQEKHIIEVTEQNFNSYRVFFKQRFGVDIGAAKELASKCAKLEQLEQAIIDAEAKAATEVKVAKVTIK